MLFQVKPLALTRRSGRFLIEVVDTGILKLVPRGAAQPSRANLAVKCRSWRGWDTMRIPGSVAARAATRATTSTEPVAEQVLEANWPGGRRRVVEFGVDGPQPLAAAIGEEAVCGDLPAGPPGVAARSAGCLLDPLHLRG